MTKLEEIERDLHAAETACSNILKSLAEYVKAGPSLSDAIMKEQGTEFSLRLVTKLSGEAYVRSAQMSIGLARKIIEVAQEPVGGSST